VKDFGPEGAVGGATQLPPPVAAADGELLIPFETLEIWATDGSAEGTRPLETLPQLPLGVCPPWAMALGACSFDCGERPCPLLDGQPLFVKDGTSIWVSDGTPQGTVPWHGFTFPRPIEWLAAVGQRAVFRAGDPETGGTSWWSTDGTSAATRIQSGLGPLYVSIWPLETRLLFVAADLEHGIELWSTDGTPEGTHVLDLNPGPPNSNPTLVAAAGGRAYFLACCMPYNPVSLCSTDGTTAGTQLVRDFPRGLAWWVEGMYPLDGFATDGSHLLFLEDPSDIFISDGTLAGTKPLLQMGMLSWIRTTHGRLLFSQGLQLWALSLDDFAEPRFRRGDTNADGTLDMSDAVATLAYLFLGTAAPSCLDAADANDSGAVDLSDAVFTLGYLFLGTAAPPAPFGVCGVDPTTDNLDCDTAPGC
jgi:ELWxxDGT repeat protein